MKNTGKQRRSDAVLFGLTAVLFAVLAFLTVALIMLYNSNTSQEDIPFDLDRLTSDDSMANKAEIADALLPEFIGITVGGNRYGISASSAVMTDLYGEVSGLISETLVYSNAERSGEAYWLSCADADESMYIRYHSQLPDVVIGMFADASSDRTSIRDYALAYVYEMFIIPSRDGTKTGEAVVRSIGGDVFVYRVENASMGIMAEDLTKYIRSYTSSMKEFIFSDGEYVTDSPTEPVFIETVTTRNILTTDGTAFLIKNSQSSIYQLMRVFGLNPNKLLSSHEEPSGKLSYTDRSGILYLEKSAFEYRAADDGGVAVTDIIGYTDGIGLSEYIAAVYGLMNKIAAIESHCAGGSADLYLVDISSDGREVSMTFEFFYDNILVIGTEPALTVTFRDGKLTYARLFTVTVKSVSTRSESFGEWWFFDRLAKDGTVVQNVGLVYRSDYISDSVRAEWRAVTKASATRNR
ncbi:MAG: hypothetical protein E7628_05040 [Ruminococcaceae bacterium]|nr:hypothetical protein [Oscillospiraceae bacterium]